MCHYNRICPHRPGKIIRVLQAVTALRTSICNQYFSAEIPRQNTMEIQEDNMYKNRAENGRNNLCGANVRLYRLKLIDRPSQKKFADMLQVAGLDIDKNAVQRIESGERFVTQRC